jgi:hypothetical protein
LEQLVCSNRWRSLFSSTANHQLERATLIMLRVQALLALDPIIRVTFSDAI